MKNRDIMREIMGAKQNKQFLSDPSCSKPKTGISPTICWTDLEELVHKHEHL